MRIGPCLVLIWILFLPLVWVMVVTQGPITEIEFAYDDGVFEGWFRYGPIGSMAAVRFTPTASGVLKTVRFHIGTTPAAFKIHIMNQARQDTVPAFTQTASATGWFDIDVSAQGVLVTSGVDFYVGAEWTVSDAPEFSCDYSSPDSRSYRVTTTGTWSLTSGPYGPWDHGIRAVVQLQSWSLLDGPSPEAPAIVSSSSLLYFTARGVDNRIWYRTMTASGVWSSWTPLLGFTDARPAVAVFNSRLYFFCKQFGANSIWYGYYPLSGGVVSGAFSGWYPLDGPTPSAVSLASSPDHLYVAARGMDGSIWHRRMNAAGAWSGWSRVLGFTDVSPAIAIFNNRLYLVCKQSGAQSIWYGYVDLFTYPAAWSGWSPLGGLTPDAVTLASSSGCLYLVARSVDNSIWHRTMDSTGGWSGWSPASGYTLSPVAIAVFNGYMHLAARQAGTNNLWIYK